MASNRIEEERKVAAVVSALMGYEWVDALNVLYYTKCGYRPQFEDETAMNFIARLNEEGFLLGAVSCAAHFAETGDEYRVWVLDSTVANNWQEMRRQATKEKAMQYIEKRCR